MTHLLYVAEYPDEKLSEITQFSTAGHNKKRGYLDAMDSEGYDVTLLSPVFVPATGRSLVPSFSRTRSEIDVHYPTILRLHPIPNLIVTIVASILALYRLGDEEIEAVVFWNFELQYCLPAIVASIVFDAKLVVEYEDGFFNHPNRFLRLSEAFCKRIAPIDGALLTTSKLADHVPTENTEIVRGVTSVFKFPDLPEAKEGDQIRVLFSGGLREGKGVDCFIEMAALAAPRHTDCRFLICGHGKPERKEELRRHVRSLNMDTIDFLGTVEPWEKYLELVVGADVLFVLEDPRIPFNQYCFPSKLIEYAKSGNIVITSDISDVKILDPQPFMVVEQFEAESFAESLSSVINNLDEERETARRLSRQYLEAECSPAAVGEKIDRVIQGA